MRNDQSRHNQRSRQKSLDGFTVRPSSANQLGDDVRVRFRQNYRPAQQQIDEVASNEEGLARNAPVVDSVTSESSLPAVDLSLDTEQEQPKASRWRLLKRRKKPVRRMRTVFRAAGVLSVAFVIGVSSLFAYGYLKSRGIFQGNGEGAAALNDQVQPSQLNGEGDGRVNILLLGKGGPGHEAPDLTDTLLLASIDPVNDEVALISVPRDLYVEDQFGSSSKINAIYATSKNNKLAQLSTQDEAAERTAESAGVQAIKQKVGEVLGVPVHYYVMVDFTAFEQAINTVGGITVDVEEPLYDATMAWQNGGSSLIADEGLQTFDGRRALMYARSRYGSARGDFDRSERQKEVLIALQQKVLSLDTFSNPLKVVELLNTFGDNVRTDLNGVGEVKALYDIGKEIPAQNFFSIGLADPPNVLVSTGFYANQSVVLPTAGLFQYDEIQSFVRNTIKDPHIRREAARIVVLNGTDTAGLATQTAEELRSFGYDVVDIDNAPSLNYQTTQIIDLTNKSPFTLSYLQRRMTVNTLSPSVEGIPTSETADFVIILGQNEALKASN